MQTYFQSCGNPAKQESGVLVLRRSNRISIIKQSMYDFLVFYYWMIAIDDWNIMNEKLFLMDLNNLPFLHLSVAMSRINEVFLNP